MKPTFNDHDLDAELVFDRLLARDDLIRLQALLGEMAPRWCRGLRYARSARDLVPIDVSDPDALASVVVAGVGERGATYWSLVEEHGRQPFDRYVGSVELRGAGPELTIVIALDQMVAAPLGRRMNLGNRLTLQVRRPHIDRRLGRDWLEESFATLASALSPAWGSARHPDEYWAKVMSDTPRVEAVGRDFGRSLPGLFWRNFFGPPYCELVGYGVLASAPGSNRLGAGFLVGVGVDPADWASEAALATARTVREHLGDDLFFSRAEPDRPGRAPDWNRPANPDR